MRDALATALGDATTQLIFRDPSSGTWSDARGRPSDGPHELAPSRAVTAIDADDGRHDVALIHDVALLDDPELLDGVSDIVLAGWRHERLTAHLSNALTDLEDSRRRIAEAADVERARIERDLHDGAQQRLIALRIRLGLAEELLTTDPGAGVREIQQLGFEAERALEELRSLADGVYPPMLTGRGLHDALRSVAAQASMPVHVVAVGVTRHAVEIESAVYFTCVEALQNALEHAAGATGVWIELSQTRDRLNFEISDDGAGFPRRRPRRTRTAQHARPHRGHRRRPHGRRATRDAARASSARSSCRGTPAEPAPGSTPTASTPRRACRAVAVPARATDAS